jgi:hypothetical protein
MDHPTDFELAQLAQAIYSQQPAGFWVTLLPHDGGYVGLYRWHDKVDVPVWRGSITLTDWLDDFAAAPEFDGRLGWVHSGFMGGVESIYEELGKHIARPIMVTGHSLGAAHAMLHTGLLRYAKEDLIGAVVFGCPRPAEQGLADLLADVPTRSYRNGEDPVPTVPTDPPYVHPKPLIQVNAGAHINDHGPLTYHHIDLYVSAMKGLAQ